MKPFSLYHPNRDNFISIQQALVDCILQSANPDKIFLLGVTNHQRKSESIFTPSAPTAHRIAACILLVLIRDPSNKELYEWQDKIEANARTILPVTSIVLTSGKFEDWWKAGHRFACRVVESAELLYDSETSPLPVPEPGAPASPAMQQDRLLADGLARANEFLAGSELYRIRKQHSMAAFMLHQAAEQALSTLLETGTGFTANTHNLERLLRYASLSCHRLPDLFPQDTDQEKRLFQLLQRAYIEPRYKADYKISQHDLMLLTERVEELLQILQFRNKPCANHVLSLCRAADFQ